MLVIGQPDGTGSPIGVLLTVAGVACCATYTVVTRRWLATAASTTQVIVAQQAYALAFALVLVAAALVLGGARLPHGVSAAGWASAIASGVLYYGLAYWLYLSGLRHVPASLAAVSFYLIPVFGVTALRLSCSASASRRVNGSASRSSFRPSCWSCGARAGRRPRYPSDRSACRSEGRALSGRA